MSVETPLTQSPIPPSGNRPTNRGTRGSRDSAVLSGCGLPQRAGRVTSFWTLLPQLVLLPLLPLLPLVLLVLAATPVSAADLDAPAASAAAPRQLASLAIVDMSGKRHTPFADARTKAVVLIFVSPDCPIANAFQPALREFTAQYADKGVRSFMVYSSPSLTAERISGHRQDFKITMPAVLDSTQRLGKLTAAKVTPEAILIDRQGAIRYRGLINNLYAGFGKKRAAATRHFLRDACDAVLAGEAVAVAETKPIGCFISYAKNH